MLYLFGQNKKKYIMQATCSLHFAQEDFTQEGTPVRTYRGRGTYILHGLDFVLS